ncbi:Gfo/Idh/MocA family oxidoreductase [Microbacterium sp. LWS13-1.2]|uniref:Gfo/Idh/MocA family oxidoreductase n=1 Tax=Microbacterium sp. LWS13-1.2 TaxID=3135264 RepID=A0AAU6SE20_9MICO
MSENPIRVGIIGADTAASWAGASHIPAIAAQPRFVLEAVATRREESAKRAAKVFGARRWFADPYALIADPDIDLVTVAVKVPAHRDLVMAALAAGKAVYSESPLGANLGETEEMAAAVGSQHTVIGLQGSLNPSVRRAVEIIAKGAIGCVLSARVHATTFGYGPESISAYDYFNKQEAGASFLTITTAHVLDVIETVLGQVTEVDARTERLWPQVVLTDSGEVFRSAISSFRRALGSTHPMRRSRPVSVPPPRNSGWGPRSMWERCTRVSREISTRAPLQPRASLTRCTTVSWWRGWKKRPVAGSDSRTPQQGAGHGVGPAPCCRADAAVSLRRR